MIKEAKKELKNFSKEVVKNNTFKILEDIILILITWLPYVIENKMFFMLDGLKVNTHMLSTYAYNANFTE